jgi:hypothetical protein
LTKKNVLPQRPQSEYIFFCKEMRPIIKNELIKTNPAVNIKEITLELGKKWQEFKLNPDKMLKEKIAALALEDKQRYNEEKLKMSNF